MSLLLIVKWPRNEQENFLYVETILKRYTHVFSFPSSKRAEGKYEMHENSSIIVSLNLSTTAQGERDHTGNADYLSSTIGQQAAGMQEEKVP